ncbi:MAG: amidase [Deltaproteobacteria bacterium]|nr:amidase [Deltaproteobacteria bacterium]
MMHLALQTATDLSKIILNRQITSVELVNELLNTIDQKNRTLNAIVTLNAESARQRAKAADEALGRGEVWGPLHGIPVTVKDVYKTKGMRTTAGHTPLKDYVPSTDACVVAQLRNAGAIILGKTNTPALAMDVQTENRLFGATRNPWHPDRTCGGSSGGDAAAVASGMSPMSTGSDIGGSVRIPAHFCGVYAFKPSDGVVSIAGHIPPLKGQVNTIRHLAVPGVIARSVADLQLWLNVVSSSDRSDKRTSAPFATLAPRALKSYRFIWSDSFGELTTTRDTQHAIASLASKLADAGCQVTKVTNDDISIDQLWRCYGEIFGVMAFANLPAVLRWMIPLMMPLLTQDPISRAGGKMATAGVKSWFAALERRDDLIKKMSVLLDGVDAWITPVCAGPAFPHRKMDKIHTPIDVDGTRFPGNLAATGFTCPFNLTGFPAVVLPLSRTADGLPIGVQLVGRFQHDEELLNVAEAMSNGMRFRPAALPLQPETFAPVPK